MNTVGGQLTASLENGEVNYVLHRLVLGHATIALPTGHRLGTIDRSSPQSIHRAAFNEGQVESVIPIW